MNPLTVQLRELRAHLAARRDDRTARALVLTGDDKAFCAGADLSSMGEGLTDGRTLGQRTAGTMHQQTQWLPPHTPIQEA
jgi:enoyl-CoA hydratase/carnithine racemase